MQDTEDPWHFTVVRVQGLRLMRPEKSWRPIITVEIDNHHVHETVLGCDGQNPNQKQAFQFHHASISAEVNIRLWRSPQTKKKKTKILVAKAVHTLGELLKRQETDPKFEVRLQCQRATSRSISSRGKPQNGATILCKIRAPSTVQRYTESLTDKESDIESDINPGLSDDDNSTDNNLDSPTISTPDDAVGPEVATPSHVLRQRKRLKGFMINSDDEIFSTDDEDCVDLEPQSLHRDVDDDASTLCDNSHETTYFIISKPLAWIAASCLPQYTEKLQVPSEISSLERALATFIMYNELKAATHDSHYEKVLSRLQQEWTFTGGLLVALAAVNTGVFAISPGSIFAVNNYALGAIASSSVSAGLGIACDAWFLLRYGWADLHTFVIRARDIYGSYFFFSLSSRVPVLCMFISAVSLFIFLSLVAYGAWPEGVLIVCFLVGLIMTMQFLVFGAHWCVAKILHCVRTGYERVVQTLYSIKG